MTTTGTKLEALVRSSVKAQGLSISQTAAPFRGKVGPRGKAKGRIVAKGELDFTGHVRGRYVAFDAKSTMVKTRFDLALLKRHQVRRVKNAHLDGAIAFFLIEFSTLEGGPRYYALTWPVLEPAWEAKLSAEYVGPDAPQSIPLATIARECLEVKRVHTRLDLADAIATLAQGGASCSSVPN